MLASIRRLTCGIAVSAAAAVAISSGATAVPPTPETTITIIRHGESKGNISGKIEGGIPGPVLSPEGEVQAKESAVRFADAGFDGIYASVMTRTQQTAAPLAAELGMKTKVIQGIQEIPAGIYEGTPTKDSEKTYYVAPKKWMNGDLAHRIPGAENGVEFMNRYNRGIAEIVSKSKNPVIFSHGAAIMVWTVVSVKGLSPSLWETNPMKNTGYVKLKGSPKTGWKLVEWKGDVKSTKVVRGS